MAIYRKTESGHLVKTAGHMVQRWNDKVFTTEHVVIDGADYYILDPDANKYLTGSTNYTILHIYVSEPNVSTDAYITFANKTLKLRQSTGGAVLVGQVSGHISLYTLDTIDNNIYIGNVLIENTVSVNINNGAEEAGKYISAITVDVMDVHKLNITKANLPVIPDISLNDNQATAGKYISKIEVDTTDKHKLIVTKETLPTGFSGDYDDLDNIPEEFPPAEHNHDDRYYTETEVDTKLGGKANTTHNHTKSEITDFPTSMTPTTHNHTKSEITDFPTSMPPSTHNHDASYYQKSETYTKTETDALVGNLQGQTQELKSITTQPSGTFVVGDLYYNSSTKGLYYYTGSAWELTGLGVPMTGVIYSFHGILYFWDESTLNLIQIGAGGSGGWELTIKEGFFA